MASKLIELKEAAAMLGVTPDELNEMRSRNELYGYRDGATWKFKSEEIEKVAADRGIELKSAPAPAPAAEGGSGIDADLEELIDVAELDTDEPADAGDSETIQVDGADLSLLDDAAATAVGKKDQAAEQPAASGSGVEPGGSDIKPGSDVSLVAESGIGNSDVKLVAGSSDVLASGSKAGSHVLSDGSRPKGPADTANMDEPDELSLDSDLGLGDEELSLGDEDLALGEAGSGVGSGVGSAIDLDAEEEGDVLGSGIGSDVTKGAADSGISLGSPSESGLSLEEEPLELGGSAVESLELGEDDMVSLEEEATDPDAATQLKADDDFLLTPVEDAGDDESDSGSQVIALDTEEFDESADTLLTADGLSEPLLEEEADLLAAEMAPGAGAQAMMAAAPVSVPELPEARYTIWNVLSLMFIVLLLAFTGMMMVDLLRNMWSWDGTYTVNSPIMDKIIEIIAGSD